MRYSAKLLDYFENPRCVGEIEGADVVAEVSNPVCGDVMKLWLKIDGQRIVDARFKAQGCSAAIATSSYATEMVIGMEIEQARRVTKEEIAEALGGLPSSKLHCSVLASEAIQKALKDFRMIAVAMSGGVDSSAAAVLLKRQGCDIVGLSMQLWDQRRKLPGEAADVERDIHRVGRCCSIDDIWDARRVASHIGIPFYVMNLEDRFEETVVAPFVASYLKGETPSPCVLCNNHVKFRHLVERAEAIGAGQVATGHYARVARDEPSGRWRLLRGRDRQKDQSYFLFGLTQGQLARTVFPLGELTKPEVREIARTAGLPTFDKPESQEICFVQGKSYADFVEQYAPSAPAEPGSIVNREGAVVGAHAGVHRYTVGQRKGIGAAGRPQYVTRIDTELNRIVIGDDADLRRRQFRVRDANWIAIENLEEPVRCDIQIRNRFEPQPGTVRLMDGAVTVEFDEAQRAVTPGQAAVLYWGDVVVGGGWISALAGS